MGLVDRTARSTARAAARRKPHRRTSPAVATMPTERVDDYVRKLASRHHVVPVLTGLDHWANAVTLLAGDAIQTDATEDLLVALRREGKVTAADMASLLVRHLREKRARVCD